MWIKHNGTLYNLDNGTTIERAINNTQVLEHHFIRITVLSVGTRCIDCKDEEEARVLFKDICFKLMPEEYH